ncbi:MAG: sulfatase-like hydrolase/transferase [Synoicihabitans sp.]
MSDPASPHRPNILFVITDDHQADALGTAGHAVVKTPTLDQLAARGVRFPQATHAGSMLAAICSPARACLLTGRDLVGSNCDPGPTSGPEDTVTLNPDAKTLPELLGESGYETFFTGKWHNDRESFLRSFQHARRIFHGGMCDHDAVPLIADRAAFLRGETPVIGEGFSTELFCGAMVDYLQNRDSESPFFAWLSLTSPHDPRTPPENYLAQYPPDEMPLPPAFLPEPKFDNGELDIRDERLAPKPLQEETVREHVAGYYGMITHQDAQIGRVLQALEDSGAADHTIVVYVGDHGLSVGNHGLLGKQNLYEHSTRVPLIMAGPGVPAGETRDGLVYSLDVFATLLELAGLDAPTGGVSRSLVPQFSAGQGGRSEVVSLYKGFQRMIRESRWKLIEYRPGDESRIELFDLEADPHELHNLAGDPGMRETIFRLRQKLSDWQSASGDRWMPINLSSQPLPVAS